MRKAIGLYTYGQRFSINIQEHSNNRMTQQLTVLSELPEQFYDFEVSEILQIFPTPTLIHLEGKTGRPLFVSILLHGNEFSGLKTIQALLKKYADGLPRPIYLFIGNVTAAASGERVVPGQTDFNRCWPGTDIGSSDETKMMQQVVDIVTATPLFSAIDLHNNSGFNPHYACITSVTQENYHIAAMFNHIGMVFRSPKGVSTMAFDGICPAATLECGRPGDEAGINHALELLDALLHMQHLPQRSVGSHDLQLVQSFATLKISPLVSFDFNLEAKTDITFDENFERKNFTEFSPKDVFAYTTVERPLSITNQQGNDVTDDIIHIEDGKIYLKHNLMPAMITVDKSIVRQDCLCYLLVDYQF